MNQVSETEFQKEIISEYYEQDHDRRDELFKNFQNYKHSDYPRAQDHFVPFQIGLQRNILWERRNTFPDIRKNYGRNKTSLIPQSIE